MFKTISNAAQKDADRFRSLMVEMGRKRTLRDPLFSACEELQLTPPQFHTILWLGHDGDVPMGELARRLGITEKTMTGLIDRLEREKFVERARSEDDRRVVNVRLTKNGRESFRQLDQIIDAKLQKLMAMMTGGDRKELLRIMENLLKRVDSLSEVKDSK